jgi:O-antigen/teichoic acid export membrane protein
VIFWSQLVIFVLSSLLAHDYIRLNFSRSALRSLLAYGFPWMLVFLFGASRTYLDRAFLTQYLSSDLYGVYNFSVRVASLLSLVITAFDMSFGPLAFSIWNKETAPAFFARLQSLYTFLICAFACAICVFSPLIIQVLGGEKYAGSENILPILLFAAIPLSLINFSNLGINHAKKSILSTVTLFFGLVVVLILNFLLTRHYLQYGATTASLIGHLVIIITGYYFSTKYYKIPFAYAKDSMVFLLFLVLSVISVNFTFSPYIYYEMLIESVILAIVIILLVIFVYNNEYRRGLSAIGVR